MARIPSRCTGMGPRKQRRNVHCHDCGTSHPYGTKCPENPFRPGTALLVKLGSIVVHADEYTSEGAHPFDRDVIRTLLQDPEVKAWLTAMNAQSLLPRKRA